MYISNLDSSSSRISSNSEAPKPTEGFAHTYTEEEFRLFMQKQADDRYELVQQLNHQMKQFQRAQDLAQQAELRYLTEEHKKRMLEERQEQEENAFILVVV